jgi:hypothetical protein
MKGGSRASTLVMETSNPKLCDTSASASPVIEGPAVEGDVRQLSLYRTTGGGRKKRSGKKSKSKSKSNKTHNSKPRKPRRRRYAKRCPTCGSSSSMVGGSKASSLVMETNPVLCDASGSPVMVKHNTVDGAPMQPVYHTTGGGRRRKKGYKVHPGLNVGPGCGVSAVDQTGGGSDWMASQYSRGPVNQPSQNPAEFRMFTQTGNYIPNESLRATKFMGGGKSKRNSKSKRRSKASRKSKKYNKSKKINSIRSDRSKRRQKGGSDWRMTQYSRGPVNQPTQNPEEFRMFTQTADFIPNEALLKPKLH